mmetsp:Transcript_18136/g.38713  ORF Transcript_18136/g.38713 Transcript_18136/m.38713 type:complete len:80 (-) Transcript_18136:146-385(-)
MAHSWLLKETATAAALAEAGLQVRLSLERLRRKTRDAAAALDGQALHGISPWIIAPAPPVEHLRGGGGGTGQGTQTCLG